MSFMYMYSIANDFPNQAVNEEVLAYEIRASDITIALDYIFIRDQIECEIYMKAELNEVEQDLLDSIVNEHQGELLPNGTTSQASFDRIQIINDTAEKVVAIDDEGRLQVLSSVIAKEHELSGPQHIGQLDDGQIPDFIVRSNELSTVSGSLHEEILVTKDDYYDKFDMDNLLANKSDISHDHDLRYYKKVDLDDMIITTHSGLSNLDADDHPQYLTALRGDGRYYGIDQINTISGVLQDEIDSKSGIGHSHDDRYYTESETDSLLVEKSDIGHSHKHSDLSDLDQDDHPQYLLTNGLRPLDGDLIVTGDLIVSGTQFISNTETVQIIDNILLLNNGEVNAGVSKIESGIEVDRGTLDNFRFVYNENTKNFMVGISGSEDPVVIRAMANVEVGAIPSWRYHTEGLPHYELTTSGSLNVNNVSTIDYVDSIASDLQNEISSKADIVHTHVEDDIIDLDHDAQKIKSKLVVAPTSHDDGKRLVYRVAEDRFQLENSGAGGGGVSFPFSYFFHDQDLSVSSTTSSWYWQTKLILRIEDVPSGKYRVGWFYQWSLGNTNTFFNCRIVIDDEIKIFHQCTKSRHYREDHIESGFRYMDLSAGDHVISLQWRTDHSWTAAYIWNTELEFWKIA